MNKPHNGHMTTTAKNNVPEAAKEFFRNMARNNTTLHFKKAWDAVSVRTLLALIGAPLCVFVYVCVCGVRVRG